MMKIEQVSIESVIGSKHFCVCIQLTAHDGSRPHVLLPEQHVLRVQAGQIGSNNSHHVIREFTLRHFVHELTQLLRSLELSAF